jgi:uncharacterized membrane protein (DUF4010 family)
VGLQRRRCPYFCAYGAAWHVEFAGDLRICPGYLVGVLLLVGNLNLRSVLRDRSLEITTSVALIMTMVLGVLVGHGHLYTPVASAVVMTLLLSWKSELSEFAEELSPEEIRSAVLMGLLGFVIYSYLARPVH